MRRKSRQVARYRPAKIFMTGATGFVGKSMFRYLPELQLADVTILSRDEDRLYDDNVISMLPPHTQLLIGDIRDFKYPEGDFDYIFHGASPIVYSDEEIESIIVEGTGHLLDFAKSREIKNLLFVSSGAVYGQNFQVRETDICRPKTIYGKAKLKAENMCINSDLPVGIARCFSFVGEFLPLDAHFAIGNFIQDCLKNRPIQVKGDGKAERSYMFSQDLAEWLWILMIQGKGIYNVGSESVVSMEILARLVRRLAETKNDIRVALHPRVYSKDCYAPFTPRVPAEFGLTIKVPLEEAIRRTIEWHTGTLPKTASV